MSLVFSSDYSANGGLPIRHFAIWVACVMSLIGCSGAEPTATTLSGDRSTTTTPVSTTTEPTATTTTRLPVDPPRVEPSFPQDGAAAPRWEVDSYASPEFAATLARLADAGAGWVTLVPTWYQREPASSVIFPETPGRTTADEALVAAIREAKELGLSVVLKPHVDLVDGESRILIDPSEEKEWFSSYSEMILRYAAIADIEDVDQFVIGTELGGTSENTAEWEALIAEVRDLYPGPISYAANHDEYQEIEFWESLDFIGVDAYFPLAASPTTDSEILSAAWDRIAGELGEFAERQDRAVVFTEVGYPSLEGAVVEPFNPFHSETPSNEEQAAALEAMIESVSGESWFGGFHWWMWFEENTSDEYARGYMPEGKPAGAILEEYWTGR